LFKLDRHNTATGTPKKYDCAEVVTLAQLILPVDGQARMEEEVKCATVKAIVIGIPIKLRPKQTYRSGVMTPTLRSPIISTVSIS
jgi:hypothetical protein